MTTLIIARHGNTFGPEDTVTYVGARTDIPLVDSGRAQAAAIGRYLKAERLIPDAVYASALKRTQETAAIAIKETGVTNPVYTLDIFNEIDYGPDENKTRDEIIARIGPQPLKDWDLQNLPPPGWAVNPQTIIQNWTDFATQISAHNDNETILVVTSNGIARFAPYITGDYADFLKHHSPKMATGALSVFTHAAGVWTLQNWNLQPQG
jgi:2,3-bisphosphoglycerate-dependent phosphoglycerate mutase